jgi:mitotic spindle assembly checkpoint protein MAD2
MEDETSSKTEIALNGSVEIVLDFFFTAINSILYQRGESTAWLFVGSSLSFSLSHHKSLLSFFLLFYFEGIYMPETFARELKYGLTCLTTTDEGLLQYLSNVQRQVNSWLETGTIQRLVLVVKGVETMQTLERWQFNVAIDETVHPNDDTENQAHNNNVNRNHGVVDTKPTDKKKSIQEIHKEIQAIIRQITASVTFLPLLQESCTFDLLVYTDKDIVVPPKWADSDPCYVANSSQVKLRTFTTSLHKIDSMVAYKKVEDWEL